MDWYPWNFVLYKADTMHLNPYQDGCYRRLIDHYMETRAPLLDNDAALARIIGDSVANWEALASPTVRPYFRAENGLLFHTKCDDTLAEQDALTRKLSESGKKGAEKRHRNKGVTSPPIATLKGGPKQRTGQDKEESPNGDSPRAGQVVVVSSVEIDMEFQKVWSAYPGHGKDGARGAAFKGDKKPARVKFESIYKNEKESNRAELIRVIIAGCGAYQGHLERSGYPSKHLATWINARGWETDYSSTSATPSRSRAGQGYSIDDVAAKVMADKTGGSGPAGRRERLKALGIDPDIAGGDGH